MNSQHKWWQEAVFYQIYPRSFADGNGDGLGDFEGMTSKLDYLQDLGVDAIWLSPHFPSPFVDCGYDVSDYENVAPEYGNLEDFKEFLNGLHQRNMHLILDLVLNHTSDQHPWFIESRSSLNNPKRDWYIWKKGKDGLPPTNWNSTFGGSAWELDPVTDEYYYHFFFKGQPDLNWDNPEVKKAMFDSARFWLDMGVDGFRLDAVGTIFEDERYMNHDVNISLEELAALDLRAKTQTEQKRVHEIWMQMFHMQFDQPGVHPLMKELRRVIDEYEDRVLVGETDDPGFYGTGDDELHLVFNFPLMNDTPLIPAKIIANQEERAKKIPVGGWPCNTFGNHDSSRLFSRYGDGAHNQLQARAVITLLLTMKGTPFLYYGEEIGMSDYLIDDASRFRDTLSLENMQIFQKICQASQNETTRFGAERGRDKCRTPMQWTNQQNAGFCPPEVIPWLPVNPNFVKGINEIDEENDPESLLNYYRNLLHLRKQSTALKFGNFTPFSQSPEDILVFTRRDEFEEYHVLINFGAQNMQIDPAWVGNIQDSQIVISSLKNHKKGWLNPFESLILKKSA